MIYINPYAYGGFSNLYSNDMDGVNESAQCANTSAHSFTNGAGQDLPFSVVMWLIRRTGATFANPGLITKSLGSANSEWIFEFNGTTLRFFCQNPAGTAAVGRSGTMSTTGAWIGIAGTYTGNEATTGFKLYSITTAGVVTQIDTANLSVGAYTGMTAGIAPVKIGTRFVGAADTNYLYGNTYAPMLCNKSLSLAELQEIGANPHKDARTYSFGANVVSAWHFPTGTGDYPTWTDYVAGHNATMQNAEAADISTDIP